MKINSRRLMMAMQWCAIGLLSVNAVVNAATDHGILMAINCFCLGVVVFSMLCQKMIAKTLRDADAARDGFRNAEAVMMAATEALNAAVQSGQIEMVPMQPFDLGQNKPTQH